MCGVFGIYGHSEAANLAYLGLHSLQHRGQESAGIATHDGEQFRHHVAMGLVNDGIDRDVIERLRGGAAIGQVRYSTSGESELRNAQPFLFDYAHGGLAIAHNGNLTNAAELRQALERKGAIFQTSSDTEVFVHLMARASETSTVGRLRAALSEVRGAYSLTLLTETKLIAVRDPDGFRPLVLGKLRDAYVVSSETCAFELIEAEYIRDIEPGEIIVIDSDGVHSSRIPAAAERHFCVFEHVYFSRPDSGLGGRSVYESRIALGRELAAEHPVDADVVIAVPDSGTPAAMGFARATGLPFEIGLIRSRYMGRTFIEPQQSIRNFGVRLKLSPVRAVVAGRRVAVIDDSLVRGTTSRKLVSMLRAAGASEVHLRISSPPITHSCFYGIDTPTRDELIAAHRDEQAIGEFVECDSIGYLSHGGMMRAVGTSGNGGYCSSCFTGDYPVPLRLGQQ